MATNFDRFLMGILGQGVQQTPRIGQQIQQVAQGLPPELVQQITRMAAGDAVQGVNRFDQQPASAPQPPLDMTPYIQAVGGDPRRMASTSPVAPQPPVQGPVLNPNTEYLPPSSPQEMTPAPQVQTASTGKRTADVVPSGTPLNDDEGYIAVELQVPQEEGGAKPLRIMVPEHYLLNGTPDGVTVFGGGQVTPAGNIPDDVKLEHQDDPVRWLFTDERDTQAAQERDQVPVPEFINSEGVTYAGPELAQPLQTPQQKEATAASTETYSVDELADEALAGQLKQAGYTEIRGDQYPLTDPETGQVRLATQQEIIDEDLSVPVEWRFDDDAFVQQLKAAGIETIRTSQMPVMDNGIITIANAPRPSGEAPGTPLPPMTAEGIAQYDPAIANEMQSAGIDGIPDGMVLVREHGRLALRNQGEIDDDEVIFYGGQSSLPDPGFLKRSGGAWGNPTELLGVGIDAAATAVGAIPKLAGLGIQQLPGEKADRVGQAVSSAGDAIEQGVGPILQGIDNQTRGRVVTDIGDMLYERATGNDVNRQGPDWLYDAFETATPDQAGMPAQMVAWAKANPDLVRSLYENGYDVDGDGTADFTGGRAVWEYHAGNEQNMLDRLLGEIILDPTMLLMGGGAVENLGRKILGNGAKASLPRTVLGQGVRGIGKGLTWLDEAPGKALLSPIEAVARRPVVADNIARNTVNAADRVAASVVLPNGDRRLAGVGRIGPVPEGAVFERGEYTGPVGKLLNRTEESKIRDEMSPVTSITENVSNEARINAERRGMGPIDETTPPETPGGPVPPAPDNPGAPDVPRQQALREAEDVVPEEAVVDAMPPEQRVQEIVRADEVAPNQPTTVPRDATDLPGQESTVPPRGLGVAIDEPTGLPRPTPRQWGIYAPQEGGDYLVSRLWDTAKTYPNRWRAFHDEINDTIREYVERRKTVNQQGKSRREALERERQARVREGNTVPGDENPVRLFDEAAMQTVDQMDVLLDMYQAAQRTYGDIAEIHHTFSETFRKDATRTGKDRRFYGQTDSYFIERAVFGTPRQSALALGQLRYRALDMGDEMLGREIPRIQRMRREWESVQRAPRNTPVNRVAGNDEFEMGVARTEDIKTTRAMTPEEMNAAGLPVKDFQNRTQDFAEETVRDMEKNYQSASMRPIQVVRGTDDNLYVLDGHSRLEAFRRMGKEDIPYQVVSGNADEISRAADIANVAGTANTPIDQGKIAQRRIDAGESPNDVASAMKIKRRELDQNLAVRHIDPESQLGQDLNAGRANVATVAPIGKAIGDGKLTMQEADAFYRNVVVNNDLSARAVADEVSALYTFKVNEGDGNTLFDLSTVESDTFWQARSQAASVRKEIASLRRQRSQYNAIEKRDSLSPAQKRSRRDIDQRVLDLRNDEIAADELARDAFYGEPNTTPGGEVTPDEPLLRPMTEADAAARRDVEPDVEDTVSDPTQQMRDSGSTPLFSTAPGGPQLSRALTDPETGGWRRVKNPNAGNALDPESRRTAKLIEIDDAFEARRRDFLATEYEVVLSHAELETLSRRIGGNPDSPTALQTWETYRKQFADEGDDRLTALKKGGEQMLQDYYLDAIRRTSPTRYAKYQTTFDDIMKKHPDTDIYDAHTVAMKRINERSSKVPQGYDTYLATQREIRLYNPITGWRYVMTQSAGNVLTAMLGTGLVRGSEISRGILNRRNWQIARDELREGKNLTGLYAAVDDPGEIRRLALANEQEIPLSSLDEADQFFVRSGLISNDTVKSIPREEAMGIREPQTLAQETMTQRMMAKYRWSQPFAKQWTKEFPGIGKVKIGASDLLASETIREMANAFDFSARKVTFVSRAKQNMAGVRDPFRDALRERLPASADTTRFDEVWNDLPDVFSDADLRVAMQEFGPGYAERAGRDWRTTLRNIEKDANAEVNRLFFSGHERNIDAALRRVIMFHYWMSRATPLYTASLMKHVGLATNYFSMIQSMKENSEQYGKPVQGMMKVFGSTFGYNLFIRPDGLVQTILALEPQDSFDPEGESPIFRFLRGSGLMFNPMIMSIGNFLGLAGDTFAPDPFSLQTHAAFTTTAIDLAKSVLPGAGRPTQNRYQDFNDWIRSQTSHAAENAGLPWAKGVDRHSADQYPAIEVNNLIYDIAEERGLDWDDPEDQMQIIAAMNDPESELYQAAFDRYARANFTQIALRMLPTSILYPKMRSSGKDERSLTIRTTERSDPENERARDQRDTATITDPAVATLRTQQDEYQQTGGTEEDQDAYRTYNAIRFGPLEVPIVYNGVTISERQLRKMDVDQRTAVADTWAEQTGAADGISAVRDARTEYRETHPEYGAFYDWTTQVRDFEGGPVAYWKNLITTNDNARRWYEELGEMASGDLEQRLTSASAYHAAEGQRASGYDKDPLPTGGLSPSAISLIQGGSGPRYGIGQSADPAQRIADSLAEYRQASVTVDKQIQAIYGPYASLEAITTQNPAARAGYLDRLKREGIDVPTLTGEAKHYVEWVEAQDAGADTSINAYLTWKEQYESEQIAAPEGAGDMDYQELLSLLQ